MADQCTTGCELQLCTCPMWSESWKNVRGSTGLERYKGVTTEACIPRPTPASCSKLIRDSDLILPTISLWPSVYPVDLSRVSPNPGQEATCFSKLLVGTDLIPEKFSTLPAVFCFVQPKCTILSVVDTSPKHSLRALLGWGG